MVMIKKRGEPDSSRISLSEKYEIEYWKNKLNVFSLRLSGAVRAVGIIKRCGRISCSKMEIIIVNQMIFLINLL